MRRSALAVFLTSGLALAGVIQPPAGQPQAAPAAQPAAIPVPDGPVVKKSEIEGGIIAEDIKIGDGYEVKEGGTVLAHYHGTLKADGKVFDSSFQRGAPIAFPLSGVIQGWQKGVPGMKVGGVRRLTIPAAMAYGATGTPNGSIPPNSDLVFVIQLVDALAVEDIKVGEGETAGEQFVAVATQVIKDKDGKQLEACDTSRPYIWIPGEMVPPGGQFDTMQQAICGMKVGGKRRISIPADMNVVAPTLGITRPQNVPITIELELMAVRNLPGGGGGSGGGQRRR